MPLNIQLQLPPEYVDALRQQAAASMVTILMLTSARLWLKTFTLRFGHSTTHLQHNKLWRVAQSLGGTTSQTRTPRLMIAVNRSTQAAANEDFD